MILRFFIIIGGFFFFVGCASLGNLCEGFTQAVESARASYFSDHRIYPLEPKTRLLAEKYKPQLVLHPQGAAPIDFDDYFAITELVGPISKTSRKVSMEDLAQLDYEQQCHSYLRSVERSVVSQPPYPWYVQVFRDKAPGGDYESWTYLKYNLIFDWSGLATNMHWMVRTGVALLGASPARWHRLDVHTAVIIGVDERGYQRTVTINQHNYVRTYLGGRDFDMTKPITIVPALRSNELYLDQGWTEAQRFPVVRFYDDIPYLISGEKKPFLAAEDLVVGAQAGGKEVPTRLWVIEPHHPVAAFAGLLAPPKHLLGSVYIGRDGPMGYDYYSLPAAVPLNRLASLGYWQEGNLTLAEKLETLIKEINFFDEEESWNPLIRFMEKRLQTALEKQSFED